MQYTLITALVLFSTLAAANNVPPPTNVTLQCHNFQNIVYWNYSEPSLKPRFHVNISKKSGNPEQFCADSPNLSCDISSLRDSSNEYVVTVTAVVGETESESVPEDGLSFSYFINSLLIDVNCKLDLPSVTVTAEKVDEINFSFSHPSTVYGEDDPVTKRRRKRSSDSFEYTVQAKGQEEDFAETSYCNAEVCKGKVAVSGGPENHCVNIKGQWNDIAVEATQEYCAGPLADKTSQMLAYILGIGIPVAFLCIAAIVWPMVNRKLTSEPSKRPDALNFKRTGQQETSGQSVESNSSPGTTPLLSDVQDGVFNPADVFIVIPVQDESVPSLVEDEHGENKEEEKSCYGTGGALDKEEDDNEGESGSPEKVFEGRSSYEARPTPAGIAPAGEDEEKSCHGYGTGKDLEEEDDIDRGSGYDCGHSL